MSVGAIGIFGVGAIGGSIGMRARSEGRYVIGADSNEAALSNAIALGAIDAGASVEEMPGAVDAYVISAHLSLTLREIERLRGGPIDGPSLIVDVASVKVPVAETAIGLRNFVGTHPMAGTERSGVAAARSDLFEGCTWAYVASGDGDLDAKARAFIELMGAVPFSISAGEHDRAVALTSHLPQLVALCYGQLVASSDSAARQLCGPVARELLRISGMSFDMWRDILKANAGNIEPQLRDLSDLLKRAGDGLASRDIEGIERLFC